MGDDRCKGHFLGCREIVDFTLDFLDGNLADEVRAHFRDHLGGCTECERFFEEYKRTPEVSREAFALQMPTSVKESVRSFLRNRCPR